MIEYNLTQRLHLFICRHVISISLQEALCKHHICLNKGCYYIHLAHYYRVVSRNPIHKLLYI